MQLRRPPVLASLLTAFLVLVGCAADLRSPDPSTSDTPAIPTAVPTVSPVQATPPANAAPAELAGTWRRNLAGVEILLTLEDTGYLIRRGGNMGSGAISVDGDHIAFSGSSLCDGVGTYAWEIDEGRLRLTEIEEPCTGRSEALVRGTFGRVEG
jgi:hypothetical protein